MQAAVSDGYKEDYDMNNPDSTDVGPIPMNNPEGVRMSTALTFLNAVRHRLNLTVRPNVIVRRILFEGNRRWALRWRAAVGFTAWKRSR